MIGKESYYYKSVMKYCTRLPPTIDTNSHQNNPYITCVCQINEIPTDTTNISVINPEHNKHIKLKDKWYHYPHVGPKIYSGKTHYVFVAAE